jgi:hypothetical protein
LSQLGSRGTRGKGPGTKRRSRKLRNAKSRSDLHIEQLEERNLLSVTGTGFRPIDEVGNNIVSNPMWGTAGSDLLRNSPVAYADGISAPSLASNPSARLISDLVSNQADPAHPLQDIQTVDQASLSDWGYVWGQFIDHDMDLTLDNSGQSFPILVPAGDPIGGAGPLPFNRSQFDPTTGTSTSNPRQQINHITAYLDLSQIYSSDPAITDILRLHRDGLMKTSPGNMLPYDTAPYFTPDQVTMLNMANDPGAVTTDKLFATGDRRGNETLELTMTQTLFVRNHNRIAAELQALHPNWSDEQLFQEARKLNIAEEEIITYYGYLPDLLGPTAIAPYAGYDPTVNAGISTEFSTVGFRFGHSLLSNLIHRDGNDGQALTDSVSLASDFFDPNLLNPAGIQDPLTGLLSTDIGAPLKGSADGDAQAMDLFAVNEVRNLLFGNGKFGGQDLIARDIQRARDHGIGTYNQVRMAYHLSPAANFSDISSDPTVQAELAAAYGTVANVDPFIGGLAEDHVAGADMGPLFRNILVDQFTRLRNGDRFFFLNENWNLSELMILSQGLTLTQVIEANTTVTNMQADAFRFTGFASGRVTFATGTAARGFTVQLEDTSGDILASTVTNLNGGYSFNQLSVPSNSLENAPGLSATGFYNVVLVLPSGLVQLSGPGTFEVTRGGLAFTGLNFTIGNMTAAPPGPGFVTPLPGGGATGTGGAWAQSPAVTTTSPVVRSITVATPSQYVPTQVYALGAVHHAAIKAIQVSALVQRVGDDLE